MQPGDSRSAAGHAPGVLQHCGSDYDRAAGQRQRRRRGLGGEVCFRVFRDGFRRRHGGGNYDLPIPGAEERGRGQKKLPGESAGGPRGCGCVYRSVPADSPPDYGALHHRRENPAGGGRVSYGHRGDVFSHGRGGDDFHTAAVPGKGQAAPVCQHCLRRAEHRAELHSHLRKMGLSCHGGAGRGGRDRNCPVGEFPADGADDAGAGGHRVGL